MKKIKILRIITRINIGGPAIHTILLTEGLDKNRFDSLLVCGSTEEAEGNMLYYADRKDVKPQFIPELKRELIFFNDIIAFLKIYKIIKKEHPDILHTHTAKAGTLARLAGILYNVLHFYTENKIKFVHTFHGHIFDGYFSKFKSKIFIIIEKSLAFFTSKIITVSESMKKELISLSIGNNGKIEVIPLGFELDKFLNIPSRNSLVFNIGIIGRLVPIKNHRLFLKVAASLIKTNPQFKLRFKIIGDGKLREELENYARRLDINAQVDFLGWQREVHTFYSDLDVVALTSMNEGTPVSLIEAMASGRTIVATDVGGVRDLLGAEMNTGIQTNAGFKILQRGIIVKSGDSFGFANALVSVLQNDKLRKSTEELARNFVKTRFTKDRLIKDIDILYCNLINQTNESH